MAKRTVRSYRSTLIEKPPELADGAQTVHTPTLTLNTAALFALVGMILMTILLVVDLIVNIMGVMGGVLPAVVLLKSLIYAFASLGLVVFLYIFRKAQSRWLASAAELHSATASESKINHASARRDQPA